MKRTLALSAATLTVVAIVAVVRRACYDPHVPMPARSRQATDVEAVSATAVGCHRASTPSAATVLRSRTPMSSDTVRENLEVLLLTDLYESLLRASDAGDSDKGVVSDLEAMIEAVACGRVEWLGCDLVWQRYVELLAQDPKRRLVVGAKRMLDGRPIQPLLTLKI
jgi:hypothetical protein